MSYLAVIMFCVDVLASFMVSVAYIAMKKGHMKVENTGLNGTQRKNPYLTCEWLIGIILMVAGSLLHVVVLPFVDLVVLQAGTSIAILLNTILAVFYLGEVFMPRYDIPAFSMIIGGSIAIVLFSSFEEKTYTPDIIRDLLWSTATLIFTLIYVLAAIAAVFQYQWHKR